jgi:hypothetical protein
VSDRRIQSVPATGGITDELRALAADAALMTPDEADAVAVLILTPLLPRMSHHGRTLMAELIEDAS